eukprot:TRINITY_DN15539_c0_g1_i1.p1 TRINITY_DN15539_c0_g1~~TRINITY_DN15539_c0_g1_i1.p1  ORF type:complete len:199 (+),score=93.83 TRINITY_DN15539_c0_g1_i1:40-636(+)
MSAKDEEKNAQYSEEDSEDYSDSEPEEEEEEKEKDENWDEWEDEEDFQEELQDEDTKCLFCSKRFPSTTLALEHMTSQHDFDFNSIKKDWALGFYSCIKMINYIRKSVRDNTCPFCETKLESETQLEGHLNHEKHCKVNREASFWKDEKLFIPIYEDDPLLRLMNDDDDFEESNEFVQEEEINMEELTANHDLLSSCR